ncbi:hypothetical protein [Bradyrhizobium sp. USDA 4486]
MSARHLERAGLLEMPENYRAACYRDCYQNPHGRPSKAREWQRWRSQETQGNKEDYRTAGSSSAPISALQNRVHQFNSGRGLHHKLLIFQA